MKILTLWAGEKTNPIQSQTKPILVSPQIFWGLKGYLKKQSQFDGGRNWRKLLFERLLWQYTALRGTKKQTQFKACPERSRMGQFPGFISPSKCLDGYGGSE